MCVRARVCRGGTGFLGSKSNWPLMIVVTGSAIAGQRVGASSISMVNCVGGCLCARVCARTCLHICAALCAPCGCVHMEACNKDALQRVPAGSGFTCKYMQRASPLHRLRRNAAAAWHPLIAHTTLWPFVVGDEQARTSNSAGRPAAGWRLHTRQRVPAVAGLEWNRARPNCTNNM